MSAEFVIGIDLGTTNSVLSYAQLSSEEPHVKILDIPQVTAANTIEKQQSLPSFCYIATEAERESGSLDLDWTQNQPHLIGSWAKSRAAEVPDRTVGAAKSWLCNAQVNRRQAILPWNAPDDVEKISPVLASQRYLEHLMDAWNDAFPEAEFKDQKIVLTVPASFDPVARDLTREAAAAAGFPADFVLLEEPQAAVYAWLEQQGDDWRKTLKVDQTILVCDVGGGTTDLTLIRVGEEQGDLILEREAVGGHLLVGGDNMDLALAFLAAEQFKAKGTTLDPWQSVSLWHSCRDAKENLLGESDSETHTISVLGRGSKLIGGTVSIQLNKTETRELLINGFLPTCGLGDKPQRQPQSGFQEIGLAYESDPAISRHVAEFLSAQCGANEEVELPSHILFNGGVFKADGFRDRFLNLMQSWSPDDSAENCPRELKGLRDLDFAVARGACAYGWSKEKGGMRIRGGVPASYYVGIESAGLAIPGAPRPLKALCVVPFGMEEGTEIDVPSQEIGLVLGQPVSFRFFSSGYRKEDIPGTMLNSWTTDELRETDPLEATLTGTEESENSYVPVRFHSQITELGVFELWCVGPNEGERWKLEFSVRDEE